MCDLPPGEFGLPVHGIPSLCVITEQLKPSLHTFGDPVVYKHTRACNANTPQTTSRRFTIQPIHLVERRGELSTR